MDTRSKKRVVKLDIFLFSAGLMNPGGRKGTLIAALMVLQWILPFMTVVSSGVSQILTLLKKVLK